MREPDEAVSPPKFKRTEEDGGRWATISQLIQLAVPAALQEPANTER